MLKFTTRHPQSSHENDKKWRLVIRYDMTFHLSLKDGKLFAKASLLILHLHVIPALKQKPQSRLFCCFGVISNNKSMPKGVEKGRMSAREKLKAKWKFASKGWR